jgi:PEGA domain
MTHNQTGEPKATRVSAPTRVPPTLAPRNTRSVDQVTREVERHFIVRPFAEVTVDGEHIGTTPRDMTVKLGTHHVLLTGHVNGADKRDEFDINVTKEMTVSRNW